MLGLHSLSIWYQALIISIVLNYPLPLFVVPKSRRGYALECMQLYCLQHEALSPLLGINLPTIHSI